MGSRRRIEARRLLVFTLLASALAWTSSAPAVAESRLASGARLSTSADDQIVQAFHAVNGNASNALGRRYLQGYDLAMWAALDNAAASRVEGFAGRVSTAQSISQVHRVSPTVATALLTFSEETSHVVGVSERFEVTAVKSAGRWQVSWATQCALVQAANEPCPPTPRGIRGTVPVPTLLASSPSVPADAGLVSPSALAVRPDGSLLIADTTRDQILRRAPDGSLSVFAGDGQSGSGGDGGPATNAELQLSYGSTLVVAPGGTVYFTDTGNNRLQAVSADGIITTVASVPQGGGSAGTFDQPRGLALATNGTLYVAVSIGVSAVSPNGTITAVVTGGPPYGEDIEASGSIYAFSPTFLAFDGAGDLDVFSYSPKIVFQVPVGPEGLNANAITVLGVDYVNGMTAAPGGTVVEATHGGGIERIEGTQITSVFNPNTTPVLGYGTPGTDTGFIDPQGVAVSADGTIYTDTSEGDGYSDRIGLIAIPPSGPARALPITSPLDATVPAPGAADFPATVYPAAAAARGGTGLSNCPSPSGLVPFTPAAATKAVAEAAGFGTNFSSALQLSDRSWWPSVFTEWTQGLILGQHKVDHSESAAADLAANAIARACGDKTLQRSLVVEIGRSAYSEAVSHFFFVDRDGTPLIYYQGI